MKKDKRKNTNNSSLDGNKNKIKNEQKKSFMGRGRKEKGKKRNLLPFLLLKFQMNGRRLGVNQQAIRWERGSEEGGSFV